MIKKLLSFLIIYLFVSGLRGENLIVDVDAGSDDGAALLVLLRYEKGQPENASFKIVGITCSYGNTEEEQVEINVLKTLTIAGRDDIPVYGGAKKGFIEDRILDDGIYGTDGFGDAEFDKEIVGSVDRSKHAAVALVDMAKQYSGNISIISLGPSTNIALAITLDSNFTKHVNTFYVMGGSIAGLGNIRPNVEFNFGSDPESSYVLFKAVEESRIIMLPWETARNMEITKEWRINTLGKYDSPYVEFMNKIEAVYLSADDQKPQWVASDIVIAACMIDPSLIVSYLVKNIEPVIDGRGRGSVLVDYLDLTGKLKNAKIIQAINEDLYKKMLVRYLSCEEIPC